MAQTSGFFNAEELPDGGYDREYFAKQFAYYFALFIGNGIFMTSSDKLQIVQDASLGMKVVLNAGNAFINGYWYDNSVPLTIDVELASSVQARIDSVVLIWNATTRDIIVDHKSGIPSATPVPPPINRDDSVYELELARIHLARAQTGITNSSIQDMRLNKELCGVVHGVVDQVDMTTLFNQFTQWYKEFTEDALAEYNTWTKAKQLAYDTWTTNKQNEYNNWTQAKKDAYDKWVSDTQKDYDDWIDTNQNEFLAWFEDMRNKLGTNPATNLQLQIDGLKNDKAIVIPAPSQTVAPFTSQVSIPLLKTTDAITLYISTLPGDLSLSTGEVSQRLKFRSKQLAMVEAECTTNGKLNVVSYNKKYGQFDCYIRGCSTQ